jgi:3-oxoacyl-[acyl-carrier-protein] synthase II
MRDVSELLAEGAATRMRAKPHEHRKRVVITGIGLVTAIGHEKETFWQNVVSGFSGVRLVSRFDVSRCRTKIAATVEDFQPERYFDELQTERLDRGTQYAVAAATEAMADARFVPADAERGALGVILGIGCAGAQTTSKEYGSFYLTGRMSPLSIPMAMSNAPAFEIAHRFSLESVNLTLSTACSSSSNAIGLTANLIRSGQLTAAITGGVDTLVEPGMFHGWNLLRVMSTRNDPPQAACKPFSKNRDGLVLGEGAGMLVCEELEHASARGARIYGEIVGFGSNCDAAHLTFPKVDGEAAAMRLALTDAGVEPEEIDYVNTHGTATLLNDQTETMALKKALGDHAYRIAVNSSKPLVGHAMGASGALELIISLLSMQKGIVHQTINYDEPDEQCDLDYVTAGPRSIEINTVMSNSFGFGGNNGVLIVKRYKS